MKMGTAGVFFCVALASINFLSLGAWGQAPCDTYTTCRDCITLNPECGWCTEAGKAGCMAATGPEMTCNPVELLNPGSQIVSSGTTSSVLTPTHASVFLRQGQPLTLPVAITPGPLPLDLVLMEDLSGSFGDDVVTLRSLAADMVTRVRNEIQSDTHFGIAGFVDKSEAPFGGMRNCNPNADNTFNDCSEYEYRDWLKLTGNEQDFFDTLDVMQASGGRDWPESTLEGTFHTALCTDKTGWRPNARHIMIISSDADFHVAGEGEIIRALRPHREFCESRADADLFLPGHQDDFPSPSMVRDAMLKNNVVPIFAVTAGGNFGGLVPENIPLYEDLIEAWGFGFVTELASDSSNIIPAIFEAYSKTAETVRVLVNSDPVGWVGTISPSAGYEDALLGIEYPFTVELFAPTGVGAMSTQIELISFGFGTIAVNATTVWDCDCTGLVCPSTPGGGECNGAGTCECGKCNCATANFTGPDCGCDESAACDPPCINGECKCGACECLAGWSGPDCACSTLPCPGDCSGNGACVCGVCNCTAGFEGFNCGCSNGTVCPGTPTECSGHGTCNGCGVCQCDAGWTESDCSCSTAPCPGDCSGHGACVCGNCECDEDYIDKTVFGSLLECGCHNVSCPVDPVTGFECGVGVCECGECQCPGLLAGPSCNCSTAACPSFGGVECGLNGTCVCGTCECAPGFTGPACECPAGATCPTAVFGLECSGNGECDCGTCRCDTGWTHPTGGPDDCSCRNIACPSTCVPPFGSCECGTCSCNATLLDSLTCSHPACDPWGECVVVWDPLTCETQEMCRCDAGSTELTPVDAANVYGCACTGDRCSLPNCNGVGALNCSESCGVDTCRCKPGFIGDACQCDTNAPLACSPACANGGTCVASAGPAGCTYTCQCVPPYSGESCNICDDPSCPIDCPALTCADCLADAAGNDPRLASCVWCAAASNTSCIKSAECSLVQGEVLDVCPVAATPSPTLLEDSKVFYGGIAAIAILLALIAAFVLYKVTTMVADKRLWAAYNERTTFALDQNPIYADAFDAQTNPIYDAQLDDVDKMF